MLYGAHAPPNGPNTNLSAITLLHVGARWYDPGIGRFVQRDPIGLGGGGDLYAYVSLSPVARIDPNGLDTVQIGLSGQIIVPGSSWGFEIGFAGDDAGGFGLYIENCTGLAVAAVPGGGGGVKGTWTNAADIGTLGGLSGSGGVAAGPGSIAGVKGAGYAGGAVGIGPGVGAGAYGVATHTWMCDLSPYTSRPLGDFIYWAGSGVGVLPSGPSGYSPY